MSARGDRSFEGAHQRSRTGARENPR